MKPQNLIKEFCTIGSTNFCDLYRRRIFTRQYLRRLLLNQITPYSDSEINKQVLQLKLAKSIDSIILPIRDF